MLFNSYEFIFLFFLLVLAGYAISRKLGFGRLFLLLASLIFYGWNSPRYLPVLLCSMAVNYGLYWQMERTEHKKRILITGLVFHLGTLCCFKYLDLGGFVPLAVSFYTFTQIAFLMECYRGSLKNVKALDYGVYVTYFPKLIQGPIALPGEMLQEIGEEKRTAEEKKLRGRIDWEQVYRNLYLFLLGLFKKVLIADTFGQAVTYGYSALDGLNSLDGIIVMLSYTLQLYFDFSGYCDMAMGISGIMGISLPLNFSSPYKASNILEFWKGWHITLTRFFTKYLYIPLGGNRKGRGRTYINTLIVFFLSGLWHGTGVQFLVWGMMHGILYVITRMFLDSRRGGQFSEKWKSFKGKSLKGFVKLLGHGIAVFLTFLYVNVAWVFFRAPSLKEAGKLLGTIAAHKGGRVNWNLAGYFNLDEFWYVIKVLHLDSWQYAHYICMVLILAGVLLLVFFGKTAVDYVKTVKPGILHSLIMAVLLVWSVLSFTGVSTFLYVNF